MAARLGFRVPFVYIYIYPGEYTVVVAVAEDEIVVSRYLRRLGLVGWVWVFFFFLHGITKRNLWIVTSKKIILFFFFFLLQSLIFILVSSHPFRACSGALFIFLGKFCIVLYTNN